jgi:hypothetical protein
MANPTYAIQTETGVLLANLETRVNALRTEGREIEDIIKEEAGDTFTIISSRVTHSLAQPSQNYPV